jgi:hypothetical protein
VLTGHIAGQTVVGAPQMTLKKWYIFSSNVNLIQLLRYNSVRTYPLVILVMVVCPTKIFLSDFFYSGALLVHWRRVIERVAGHDALYGSSSAHRIVIGTEIYFLDPSSTAAFWQIFSNTLYEQMCQLGGHTKFVFLFQNLIFARSVFGPNPTGQHFYVPRSATRPPGWKAKASQMFGAAARALSGVFECNARQDPSYLLPAGRYQPKIAQNNTVPTLWVSKTLPEMYLGPAPVSRQLSDWEGS